ncbi:MAG TPA: hypothetical protein VLC09_09800 [Polyangiaceae bacterium]|nr:hypothetical protein [Polyangiaceae bacterium]
MKQVSVFLCLLLGALVLLGSAAPSPYVPLPVDGQPDASLDEQSPTDATAAACCKVCSAGKACGDSCISRQKTCHKAPGCACDG